MQNPTDQPDSPDSPTPPPADHRPAVLRDVSHEACARDYAQAANRRTATGGW